MDDGDSGGEPGGRGSREEGTVRLQLTVWEQLL
ncbi:hypothetical protein QFZ79_001000 [Arthrobacter sp. V4I6]|nr:hypothetical protein [Arthrobacter sp. V1I7]MDQ0852889.1 hypothetical protein [Arthrobacter sp. V4I6]